MNSMIAYPYGLTYQQMSHFYKVMAVFMVAILAFIFPEAVFAQDGDYNFGIQKDVSDGLLTSVIKWWNFIVIGCIIAIGITIVLLLVFNGGRGVKFAVIAAVVILFLKPILKYLLSWMGYDEAVDLFDKAMIYVEHADQVVAYVQLKIAA